MAVSAKDVMELRRQTDCGMMECKKALTQAEGDFEKAIEILREQGLATASKKAGRIAAEGMVYAVSFPNCAVVVEVNAETDFVAKNEKFVEFTKNLARVIDQNALEIIFAAGIQQQAATNMLIKPLVVSIIRQRPVMEYDASHLGNMVNRLEEALPPELPA